MRHEIRVTSGYGEVRPNRTKALVYVAVCSCGWIGQGQRSEKVAFDEGDEHATYVTCVVGES